MCEAVDSRQPHYCHSPHCLKERQREAKRLLSIEEPREDGDKRPKLNKCRKAAWRASPWSYDLNERDGCRDIPSGSFSGETTQILSIPAFSSTIGPRTLGCQFMSMSYVLLVCLSVDVSIYNLLPLFFKSSAQKLALTSPWNPSPCAVCLRTTNYNFH